MESGKPFRKNHSSSPEQDSNLNLHVLRSLAQHETSALATEESGKPFRKNDSQCTRLGSNLDIPVLDSLVQPKSCALDHVATKVGVTVLFWVGGLTLPCTGVLTGHSRPPGPSLYFQYHHYEDMMGYLHAVNRAYPDLTRLYSLGKTVKVPCDELQQKPDSEMVTGQHQDTSDAQSQSRWFRDLQGREVHRDRRQMLPTLLWDCHILVTAPCTGWNHHFFEDVTSFERFPRKNLHGLDLNRNFPDYFRQNTLPSQPEKDAVIRWLEMYPFVLSAGLHGGAVVANYPFDNTLEDVTGRLREPSLTPDNDVFVHLATVYSETHPTMHQGIQCQAGMPLFENGITNGAAWYPMTGGMQDYNYVWHGCMELTLELSCCKYPPPEELPDFWEENRNLANALVVLSSTAEDEEIEVRISVFKEGYENQSLSFVVYTPMSNFQLSATWLTINMTPIFSGVSEPSVPAHLLAKDAPVTPTSSSCIISTDLGMRKSKVGSEVWGGVDPDPSPLLGYTSERWYPTPAELTPVTCEKIMICLGSCALAAVGRQLLQLSVLYMDILHPLVGLVPFGLFPGHCCKR
uniref:(California timema) hypothetical protein n=1 Tax=Timema californicum TaxID=61474 RepID=A0A7R9P806_TIMCA|nr:unnamed protein product [Timema californicum]